MTIIKTIKEGLIVVSFVIMAVFSYQLSLKSSASALFSIYPEHNFADLKWEIIAFIWGLIGVHWYLIKNVWIGFKSRNVILLLVIFSLVLSAAASALYLLNLELEGFILNDFEKILFPTQEDLVKKNIRISIVKNARFMLISSFFTGLIGLVFGNLQLLLLTQRRRNKKNKV